MAMIFYRKKHSTSPQQGGLTLMELMIAMVILAIGVMGSMALVVRAIGGDSASKQTSNSTALAQMVTERIMAVPANNGGIVTIIDCNTPPTTFNVSTSVGGPAVTASGDLDFSAATVANYNMLYTDCDTSGRQAVYDVRWNIQAINNASGAVNGYAKILTVSSQLRSAGNNRMVYAPVATIRTIVGQGT